MADKYYEKAEKYINDDDLENAIEYFKLSLEYNSNYDSAYRLGTIYLDCYEDLELDEPDYQSAIKYFLIGANNGDRNCRKELGSLLIDSEDKYDVFEGVKWLLLSEQYEFKQIKNAIDILYENTNHQLEKDVKLAIKWFNEIIKLTRNSKILTPVYGYRNELITNYAKKIINNSNTLKELETAFIYFQRYFDKEFFSRILNLCGTKEVNLYIECADSVSDVEKFLHSLEDKEFNYDIQTKGIIYLWLARSYRDGNHNARKNIDIAISYYQKVKTAVANFELEKMVASYCDELIKKDDYETAKKYVFHIKSLSDQYRIKNEIDEFDKQENFKHISAEAMTGDIEAKLKLAKLYEDGLGTTRDFGRALIIHQELYKEHHLKTSFDFIYNYYYSKNNYADLKLLLKDARKNNIQFDYYQESKYASLISSYATRNYNDVHTIDISNYFDKNVNNEALIPNNADYIHSKLVTKYNFTGFMHETTIGNLCKILKSGKLGARKFTTDFDDSANDEVLKHTNNKYFEYARFYFYRKTPTNYHFDNDNPNSMVYLEFDWNLMFEKDALIANGNAGSDYTRTKRVADFLKNPDDFMDWDIIFNRTPISDENEQKQEIIRKRNAELLVPNFVSTKFLNKIIFKSGEARKIFVTKLNDDKILLEFKNKIIIDRDYFYTGRDS
ncbi:MAG: DUF4433 domain-containing protein [Erysipelotrichales bacterium]|nr:DUF4433 domain-containing protein [Erysipelotrichales bacterium]